MSLGDTGGYLSVRGEGVVLSLNTRENAAGGVRRLVKYWDAISLYAGKTGSPWHTRFAGEN